MPSVTRTSVPGPRATRLDVPGRSVVSATSPLVPAAARAPGTVADGGRTGPPGVPAQRRPQVRRRGRPPADRPRQRTLSRLRGETVDAGMATAEYAVATVAACGFGAVLIKAITDERVLGLIVNVLSKALRLGLG